MKNIKLYNEDNLEVMKRLPNESIDVICIDPPYLYLKNQKLERPFDELKFFSECARLLTKNGFIVMFGRGVSFYRWNCILDSLGFVFKEEIVWDKKYTSSPMTSISRVHESIVIYSKSKGVINKIKVPYEEIRTEYDLEKVIRDVNRLKTVFNNEKSFDYVFNYLNGRRTDLKENQRAVNFNVSMNTKVLGSQTVSPMIAIKEGMKEKSIIHLGREHYNTIHPTQKPVRLIERLLALVIPQDKERKDIIVADWFGGSMSTMEAVHNMGMQGMSTEIDKEYFEAGKQRIEKLFENKQEKLIL
ncbi:DNA-methyltransferase [Empedobacter falsenii]